MLLPDTKSSDRWEKADRRFFERGVQGGRPVDDDYTSRTPRAIRRHQRTQAEQAITDGAKMILLTNLDSGSGAAIIDDAKSKGVTMIDYDRLTLKGNADYYVSGDATEAGRLQGKGLRRATSRRPAPSRPRSRSSTARRPTRSRPTSDGYNEVLEPKFDAGDYTRPRQQAVPNWDGQQALTIFEQMLQKTSNKIDGVLAANDTIANSTISALKARKLDMRARPPGSTRRPRRSSTSSPASSR